MFGSKCRLPVSQGGGCIVLIHNRLLLNQPLFKQIVDIFGRPFLFQLCRKTGAILILGCLALLLVCQRERHGFRGHGAGNIIICRIKLDNNDNQNYHNCRYQKGPVNHFLRSHKNPFPIRQLRPDVRFNRNDYLMNLPSFSSI